LRLGCVGLILLTIDVATFVGWVKAKRCKQSAT
jgi:hypothetical protein